MTGIALNHTEAQSEKAKETEKQENTLSEFDVFRKVGQKGALSLADSENSLSFSVSLCLILSCLISTSTPSPRACIKGSLFNQ